MIWVFFHIITLFAAVGFFFGLDLILHRVARSGDVRAIRNVFRTAKPLGRFVPILFVLGGIFGIVAAVDRGFDFDEPWLGIPIIFFPIALIVGGAIVDPWARRVLQAAESSPDDAPSDELRRLGHDKKAAYGA